MEADDWLEQSTKTPDMLKIEDEELRVVLASFQLKVDVGYWCKSMQVSVGTTCVAFTEAFSAKYLPPSTQGKIKEPIY